MAPLRTRDPFDQAQLDAVHAVIDDTPQIAAVALHDHRWQDAALRRELVAFGLPLFVHTVNAQAGVDALFAAGVAAVYTDGLAPPDGGAGAVDGHAADDGPGGNGLPQGRAGLR